MIELRMSYNHTQDGPLGWLLLLVAVITFWLGMVAPQTWVEQAILIGLGCLFVILAGSMWTLTVRDEGEALAVRYGPLPIFRRRFHYARITGVERGRTRLIDGFGIHYVPWRGWTYNLWGWDCVVVQLGEGTVRIGSNDADALAAWLRARTTIGSDRAQG